MPKVHRTDRTGPASGEIPFRVTHREGRDNKAPSVRIKCGCCAEALIIYKFSDSGDPRHDALEIGDVYGSIAQWRSILLPILGLSSESLVEADGAQYTGVVKDIRGCVLETTGPYSSLNELLEHHGVAKINRQEILDSHACDGPAVFLGKDVGTSVTIHQLKK